MIAEKIKNIISNIDVSREMLNEMFTIKEKQAEEEEEMKAKESLSKTPADNT